MRWPHGLYTPTSGHRLIGRTWNATPLLAAPLTCRRREDALVHARFVRHRSFPTDSDDGARARSRWWSTSLSTNAAASSVVDSRPCSTWWTMTSAL